MPQDIFLADSSFAENIAFGLKKEELDINRVKDCAKSAKISDFIENSLFGLTDGSFKQPKLMR